MTLRELLGDIADRGRPGELAGPAWRRAHRMRARRRLLTVATGAVTGLTLIIAPLAFRVLSSGPPEVPAASRPASVSAFPRLAPPSLMPGQLPGGWVWGGGPDGKGGSLVHDRRRDGLIELPFDWAIPAPTGDLVFVANPDDWAGVFNLATQVMTPLQSPYAGLPWSEGGPQWSTDGTRLLRANGGHLYLTDAMTGDDRRIDLEGGCHICSSAVWLPGEKEVAVPVSQRQADGMQVYSVETGAKLRRVPWSQTRSHGFSPDGRYAVAKLADRSAIVEVASGRSVAAIDVDDPRNAYWAAPDVILVVVLGGAAAYSLQGKQIQWYAWPRGLGGGEPADFTLIRRD